jgi:hypothetical protein
MARAIRDGRQGGAKKSSRGQSIPDSKISGGKRTMSVEKKSLINNMKATKKALIASNTISASPLVSNKTASKRFKGPVEAAKRFKGPVEAAKRFKGPVEAAKRLERR